MQSSYTNQEHHEQNKQLQELPLVVKRTKINVTPDGPASNDIDLPRRLTLPFSLDSKKNSWFNGKHANSDTLLRRIRLISDHDMNQHMPPMPIARLKENYDASSFASKELISLLDTAVMINVRLPEAELQQSDLLTGIVIEDIEQRVTLTLPAIARDTEKKDPIDHHSDMTAVAGGAAISGIGDITNGVLRFVTNIVMAHIVSPDIYGIFGEVSAAAMFLGSLVNWGLSGVLVYLLPGYRVKNEQGLLGGLMRFATWITLISGLLTGILFFAFASVIAQVFYHHSSYELPLQEVAFLIPLVASQQIFIGGFQAFKEIKWKVYVDRLSRPGATLIALVIFYLFGWRMEALSFSAIGGYFCSLFIGWIALSKIVKHHTGNTRPRYTPRIWAGFAIPLFLSGLMLNIAGTTDILFISLFVKPAQAGIYIAAGRISTFVLMPYNALSMIFLPLISEYYAVRKREQLEKMFKLVTKWTLSLSLPIFLCCAIFHDAILGIFGPQYTEGGLVLAFLCFGNFVNAGTGLIFQLLVIMRRLRVVSIFSTVAFILNVSLSFILVLRFNILGAALTMALGDITLNGLCIIAVYRFMKLHPYRWDVCKPLLAGGVASLIGILLLRFLHLQPGFGFVALLEKLGLIIPFIIVYVLVLLLLRFSEEDKIVFNTVLAKFGRQKS